MATPTIRQAVSAAASGASATVNTTAASAVDDLLVCFAGNDWNTTANFTTPTGTAGTWTLQATGDNGTNLAHLKIWTRLVTSGGAQTVTVSPSPSAEEVVNTTFVLSGVDTSTPVDGTAAGSNGTTGTTSHVAPSVTTTTTDALLLCGVASDTGSGANTYTPPSGMTEQSDLADGTASMRGTTASLALSASGATGTKTFTSSGNAGYASGSIAIKGATGGGTTPNPRQPIVESATVRPQQAVAGRIVQVNSVPFSNAADAAARQIPRLPVAVITAQPARQRLAGGTTTPQRIPIPQVAYQGGTCALGLCGSGTETASVLPTARVVVATAQPARQRLVGGGTIPLRTAQPPAVTATPELGTAMLGLAAAGNAAKTAVEVGCGALGLAATGAAVKVAAVAGITGFGLVGTGIEKKVAAKVGTGALGAAGTGAEKKVAPGAGSGALGLSETGAEKKVAPARGTAAMGLATIHSGTVVRALNGTTCLGLAGTGRSAKVATATGSSTLGATGRGTNQHIGTQSATGTVGMAGTGQPRRKASAAGVASLACAATGQGAKTAAQAGATAAGFATVGDRTPIVVGILSAGAIADLATRYHAGLLLDVADRDRVGAPTDTAARYRAGVPT